MTDPLTPPAQTTLGVDAPATGEATVRGVIRSTVYQSSDGRFAVVRVMALDGVEHTVVGDLGSLAAGEQVRASGRWEQHATHGRQLRASTVVPELPSTPEGIQKLLGSGFVDGIGPEMARRIVRTFGSATLDVIAEHPDRLREVEGIGPERARKIQHTFRSRRAETELRSFLQAVGIGTAMAQRVLRRFGEAAPTVVRENPYRLATEVNGIGFKTADQVGRRLGIAEDDPRRAEGAVLHLLVEASEQGHTALPPHQLEASAAELGVPLARVQPAVETLGKQGFLVRERELLYPPPLREAEQNLAAELERRRGEQLAPIAPTVFEDPGVQRALEGLHPTQRRAVEAVREHPLLVLTGGPGTGKTTTVRAIVAMARAAGLTLSLAAPTGRAARRMTEATGEPSKTLHRLLEWNPRLGRFTRGTANPLEAELILVDEASMLDLQLASRLVGALGKGARLVLVGDADQLPSVGPGTVLADLLAVSWVPSVRLTEVFRQAASSAIVAGAHAILRGALPSSSTPRGGSGPTAPTGEFYFVRAEEAERAAELLLEVVVERIPRSFGLDPLQDVQVLVPTHKGPLGASALNAALQKKLNPTAVPAAPDAPARPQVGDKVMQLKNDYDLEVWNGDVGRVLRAERDSLTVSMEGREVHYVGDARDALALAYAATVHKAQGSEYDAVVLALHTQHFMLLHRSLLYTAVTRARRLVVVVGSERALRLAVQNARTVERYGALGDRLRAVRLPA